MVMMPISSLEDPISLKMVMMPISSLEDPIESTHLSETCEDSKLQEHEDKSAPASKRNTNQPLVDCRTLNRGSVLDGSSHFEGINMITCTIDAHQGNNNLHKMDIPHATIGSVIIIIIKHCAILAIIHQHCYHPPVGISTHCKIPFKWSKDSATILAMTCDTGSQSFLPMFFSSLNCCDQTPAPGVLSMVTRSSCLDLLDGEISTSHLLWLPVISVPADQEPKKLYPLDHEYSDGASTSPQPPLVGITMGPIASDRPSAAPDPNTFVLSQSKMQLTHLNKEAVPNIGNVIGVSSNACGRTPTTPDPANFITLSGVSIFMNLSLVLELDLTAILWMLSYMYLLLRAK